MIKKSSLVLVGVILCLLLSWAAPVVYADAPPFSLLGTWTGWASFPDGGQYTASVTINNVPNGDVVGGGVYGTILIVKAGAIVLQSPINGTITYVVLQNAKEQVVDFSFTDNTGRTWQVISSNSTSGAHYFMSGYAPSARFDVTNYQSISLAATPPPTPTALASPIINTSHTCCSPSQLLLGHWTGTKTFIYGNTSMDGQAEFSITLIINSIGDNKFNGLIDDDVSEFYYHRPVAMEGSFNVQLDYATNLTSIDIMFAATEAESNQSGRPFFATVSHAQMSGYVINDLSTTKAHIANFSLVNQSPTPTPQPTQAPVSTSSHAANTPLPGASIPWLLILGVLVALCALVGLVVLLPLALNRRLARPTVARSVSHEARAEEQKTLSRGTLEKLQEASNEPLWGDTRRCTQCNTLYQEGDAFCKKCGLVLAVPETKTALATQMITCPSCSAPVADDALFCAKCGFAVSLQGATDATVLVQTPLPSALLRDSAIVNSQAETQAETSHTRTCPACHAAVQLELEDRFCGNCGYMLV